MFNKIRLYEQSGLSRVDFCKKHRIRQSQLHYWLKVHKASITYVEHHPASIEKNKQLAQKFLQVDYKIAALPFELENIMSAIMGSKSERNAAKGLPGSMPSLFSGETI